MKQNGLMSFLAMKMTWTKAFVVIVILWTPPWTLTTMDMMATRSSLAASRGLLANQFFGHLGAAIVSVAPIAALGIGMLLFRKSSNKWKTITIICTTLLIAAGLTYAGTYLSGLAFPVSP